jgi:hypothetical protein
MNSENVERCLRILLGISFVLISASSGTAQDADPQQEVWDATLDLLNRREYSLAANMLENRLDDSELFRFTNRIQADLDAVNLLKRFSETVNYSVEKLPESKPLTVLSRDYLFKRQVAGGSGKRLYLIDDQGAEVSFPLSRLDSATWLQIADLELQSWPEKDFVIGLFLAFDRYPDIRLARTKLNAAAEGGKDVTVWIKRLEDAEQQRRLKSRAGSTAPPGDLIVGKWTVAIKNGPKLVWEFRRGGEGNASEIGGRRRTMRAKWTQESSGVYRFTGSLGPTAVVNVSGDRIYGTLADGKQFRGVRQAD